MRGYTGLIFFLVLGFFRPGWAQVSLLHSPGKTQLTLYAPNLAWVEEYPQVRICQGRNTLRLDFVRGNVDLASVLAVPADHPEEVSWVATKRRGELPRVVFLEFESQRHGVETFRIAYGIVGISARTSYTLTLDEARGLLDVVQQTDVDNQSGEDYGAAAARVVLGEVHRTQGGPILGRSADAKGEEAKPPQEVLQQDFSEHKLYALPSPLDYKTGEVKSIRSLHAPSVKVAVCRKYDKRLSSDRVFKVIEGKNSPESGLGGQLLPSGSWQLYSRGDSGNLLFLRSGSLETIPVGKEFKMDMGFDPDLVVERKLMDFRKTELEFGEYNRQLVSYGTEESYQIEIRNSKSAEVEIAVLEPIEGTNKWEIATSTHPHVKKDAGSIEFKVKVPAAGKVQVGYTVKKHEMKR